jgi:Tol biopolymer transport system component
MKHLIPIIFVAAILVLTGCGLLGGDSDDEPPSFAFESLNGTFVFTAHDSVSDRRQIYTMTHHGSELEEPVQLTSDSLEQMNPSWSPDGQQIIYNVPSGSVPEIWTINRDGTNPQPLLTGFDGGNYPAWSPDMQQIAFGGGFQSSELYLYDIPSQQEIRTESGSSSRFFRWSPDGTKISYIRGSGSSTSNLYVMNADGTDIIQLTENGTGVPVWDPDSGSLVFYADLSESGIHRLNVSSDEMSIVDTNLPEPHNYVATGMSADRATLLVRRLADSFTRFYLIDLDTGYVASLEVDMEIRHPHIDWIETPVP